MNFKKSIPLFFTSTLILLLVLSSCKMQSIIYGELGITQNKTLQKAKTDIYSSTCVSIEDINLVALSKNTASNYTMDFSFNTTHANLKKHPTLLHTTLVYKTNEFFSYIVPYYILYKNLKAYL